MRIPRTAFHTILAAALFSLHHWVGIAINHGSYTPFSVSSAASSLTFDETHAYAPLVRKFVATKRLVAEPDNYERRDAGAGVPFFANLILGSLAFATGSVEHAFIVADVIFPATLLLLFYRFAEGFVQAESLRWSVAWTTALIPFGPRNFLWMGYDALRSPPEITRTPQPEISLTILLLAALSVALSLERGGVRRLSVAAVLSSLLVYTYYYDAVAWGFALVLLLSFAVLWKANTTAIRLGLLGCLTVFGTIPFLRIVVQSATEGGQSALLARMGVFTHQASFLELGLAACAIIAVLSVGPRVLKQLPLLILTLIAIGALLGTNVQILTGYDAHHSHFWNRLIQPLGWFLAACFVAHWMEQRRPNTGGWKWNTPAAAFIAILILSAAGRQIFAARNAAQEHRTDRPQMTLLAWIRDHVPPDQVIGTIDPDLILSIPAIVPEYTYVPCGLRSLTPTPEIRERYFALAAMLQTSPGEVAKIAQAPAHIDSSQLFLALGISDDPRHFAEDYANYKRWHSETKPRRIDYVALAAASESQSQPPSNATLVYKNSDYRLFRVH